MRLYKSKIVILTLLVIVLSLCINLLTHIYDNKYFGRDAGGISGVCEINEFQAKKSVCLISGWEFYSQRFYTSEQLSTDNAIPTKNIDIGQFLGFELGESDKFPHGFGTYRMTVLLPNESRAYSLAMPEIYSACRVFVNGKSLYESGNPNPAEYKCGIGDTVISFNAEKEAEIIIWAADYDHYYSGMIYPPMLGDADTIGRIANTREFFSNTYMLTAFIMAVIFLLLFFYFGKRKEYLTFAMLCLSYMLYSSYPIIHSVFKVSNYFWYCIEDIGFVTMLWLLLTLSTETKKNRISTAVFLFTLVCVLALPFVKGNLLIYEIYGFIISAYKIYMLLGIIVLNFSGICRGRHRSFVFAIAGIFFGTSIAFDYPGMWYEPIVLGWGASYGGFFVILALGIMLLYEMLEVKKQNMKYAFEKSKTEKYINEIIHDLKAPLIDITNLTELSKIGIAENDMTEKIERSAHRLSDRINRLTKDRIQNKDVMRVEKVESTYFLNEIKNAYISVAESKNITVKVSGEGFSASIDIEKMQTALENLIMNAVRYTPQGGKIELKSRKDDKYGYFIVMDSGTGLTDTSYLTDGKSDDKNHMGIGLTIVNHIAMLHGGELSINKNIFTISFKF